MVAPTYGLLDTSVLIAAESGRPLNRQLLPEKAAISVITAAELEAGLLVAPSTADRARRLATIKSIIDIESLPVDAAVASSWAQLRVRLSEAGKRMDANDLWIAATAVANDLPLITQDADYEILAQLKELSVILV